MKFSKLLIIAVLALGSVSTATAQSSSDDASKRKINAAVMGVYNDQLREHPDDYATQFARANQYYFNGDLAAALADVNQVLSAAPAKEKELRFDAYMLRAKINDEKNNLDDELADLKSASEVNSASLSCVDMMGKLSYKMGDYDAAEKNFQIIMRDNPRNYDALYWLGKVEASRKNYERAANYVDKAVELFPAESQVYVNRADVLKMIGENKSAAKNYIYALSGTDSRQAISDIFDMAGTNYADVYAALGDAINKAPGTATYYRIRASVAMKHLHYGQALRDLQSIIGNNMLDYAGVYYDAAMCQFQLNMMDDALVSINKAIAKNASDPDYYILKARILVHSEGSDKPALALAAANQAVMANATYAPALIARARIYVAMRNNEEAIASLNQAVMTDAVNSEALLLRGWVNKYRLRQVDAATADFQKVLLNGTDIKSLRGFALHELGRDDEARQWASDMIAQNSMAGGEAYYYASALLSDIGDNNAAYSYLDSALANGFGSLFEVSVSEEPYVNLKLVRRHPQFQNLVNQYTDNFEVK